MRDLTGSRYGRLTVVSFAHTKHYQSARNKQSKHFWNCACDCGVEKIVRGEHLASGAITSCGCLRDERSARPRSHGLTGSAEHRSWQSMKARSGRRHYSHVSIYAGWLGREGFSRFLAEMGPKPTPKHELDRIDPHGNYEPGNCRWATRTEQMFNQRRNRELRLLYETLVPVVPWSMFQQRVRTQGWAPEKAARTPKMRNQHG